MRWLHVVLLCLVATRSFAAQPPSPPQNLPQDPDIPANPPSDDVCGTKADITCSLILLPLGSLLLPGLGQYWDGRVGWAYSVAAVGGIAGALAVAKDGMQITDVEGQLFLIGSQVWLDAALLSAYDTYRHRVSERLRYPEDLSTVDDLLFAPADFRALGRLRVLLPFIAIGALGIGSGFVNEAGVTYESDPYEDFRFRDVGFSLVASYGAGVGEEAFFRGYLLHGFNKVWGVHPLVANGMQSALFATAHADFSWGFLIPMGFGFYNGWLAQADNYNLRDAVFLHTWWDVFVFVGTIATDRRNGTAMFTLPALHF